jgi:cell division protein ZapE
VLVTTSNVKPDGLYKDGLNRELILPFIALLKQQVRVITLDGPTDYRRLKFEGQQVYFFGAEAPAGLDQLWSRLTGGAGGEPTEIESLGRKIHVPRAAMGAARFEFSEICEKPLGARDYLRLAHAFDAMVIDNVPQFDRTRSNAAKRFILLVDTLYDRGIKLAASFAVPLEELGADEKTRFEFARCVSRLIEMGSEDYLNAARKVEPASL